MYATGTMIFMSLDIPHLTLVFVVTVFALATAFVWMFCEVERRIGKRFSKAALARFGYRPDGSIDRNSRRDAHRRDERGGPC